MNSYLAAFILLVILIVLLYGLWEETNGKL